MRIPVTTVVAVLSIGISNTISAEEPPFPFVISYDAPENVTNVSAWLPRPAGGQGFVRQCDAHFVTDAGPIRFWGTNIGAEQCFPSHEEAARVAHRLARLGINCVRMHYMDDYAIWGDDPNRLKIDPKKLERFDYFVYQLKLQGIYTNINLHVGRWFPSAAGFGDSTGRPKFDKGLDNFEPRMIELQKDYARDLLTHMNPYTKTAYTEEPAVAFVEISNEDGLFWAWNSGQLDNLRDPYATTFRKLWNVWLQTKYGDTDRLRSAWNTGTTAVQSDELLANADLSQPLHDTWRVACDDQTTAELSIEPDKTDQQRRILRLLVTRAGQSGWSPQLSHAGIAVKKGEIYTFTCRLRCDTVRKCNLMCQAPHEPYEPLGLQTTVEIGPTWRQYRFIFAADRDESNARIALARLPLGVCELADVSLRSGGIVGLEPSQRLEDGSVPTLRRLFTTVPASRDFCDFLCELERDYWQGMYTYLKDTLYVKSQVCGTQLNCSPAHLQAKLDYIDKHGYWEHPTFPNGSWDHKDWYVNDVALVNTPRGSLVRLASSRVAGKPYVVSEYNHPLPNSYAAEGFPMLAAFSAFQDWDGIYSFSYAGRGFEPQGLANYFDITGSTAQLAHFPACAAMFLRGDVAPARQAELFRVTQEDERRNLQEARTPWFLRTDGLTGDAKRSLLHGMALELSTGNPQDSGTLPVESGGKRPLDDVERFVSDTGEICWDISQKNGGYWTVNTPRTMVFSGFVRGRTFTLGDITLKIGATRLDWATISITAVDGAGIDQPGRILIAATGWAGNQDWKLEQLDNNRITLGEQWGKGPVVCEGIPATITLPVRGERIKCYPLDESGERREAIAVGQVENKVQIELAPQHKTVWYEVDIQP